jgi:hypothetical protein
MLTKEHISRMETAEMRFVREIVGYRMTDVKRDEDIREKLGIRGINMMMIIIKKGLENVLKPNP